MRWTDKLGGKKFIVAYTALFLVVFWIDVPGSEKLAFIGTLVGLHSAVDAAVNKQRDNRQVE